MDRPASDARRRTLLGPTTIGATNRSKVLALLHRAGPSSRADLARNLGVNRATIAGILQPLLDNGTLAEVDAGPARRGVGKPPKPLWFSPDLRQIGAMRIAPSEITAARLEVDGTVRAEEHRPLPANPSTDDVTSVLMGVARACFGDEPLLGIGIAASGIVDTDRGVVLALHMAPAFDQYPVGDLLADAFGVPVVVDHHPRVQALGDLWFGQGRARSHFASVYTGEALGFGIVHDGTLLRGDAGAGGESGHTVVDLNGELCLCGRRGCWETVATLGWLRREASTVGLTGAESITGAQLAHQSSAGVATATDLLDRYAHNLAVGMANNEQVLASGTYILHGDVCSGGEEMRVRIAHWLGRFSPGREPRPEVLLAEDPDRMTLLGGGGLVLSAMLGTI